MVWWAWIVIGGGLIALELTVADAAFYLVFIGVAAVLVGLGEAAGAELPIWFQWLAFAVLSVIGMVFFRKRLYAQLRPAAPGFDASPCGEYVAVAEDVAVGARTRIELRGSQWDAVNVGDADIAASMQAEVVAQRGMVLDIRAVAAAGEITEESTEESTAGEGR